MPASGAASAQDIELERVTAPSVELVELIQELDGVLGAAYTPEQQHGLKLDALFEPHIRLFIARLDGAAAGCGGVALFDDFAEVKRMYTRPEARGRGVATAVLAHLEAEARAAGLPKLLLETGVHQHESIALYERTGFRKRAAFGAYLDMSDDALETSLFYGKDLS